MTSSYQGRMGCRQDSRCARKSIFASLVWRVAIPRPIAWAGLIFYCLAAVQAVAVLVVLFLGHRTDPLLGKIVLWAIPVSVVALTTASLGYGITAASRRARTAASVVLVLFVVCCGAGGFWGVSTAPAQAYWYAYSWIGLIGLTVVAMLIALGLLFTREADRFLWDMTREQAELWDHYKKTSDFCSALAGVSASAGARSR
jgi:hypothetical protein